MIDALTARFGKSVVGPASLLGRQSDSTAR